MSDFAIVIGTSPGREEWLSQCLASIDREVLVVSGFGFELRKIQFVFEQTTINRFVFLQDSMKILDNTMFDILASSTGSQCLIDDPGHLGSYVAVYERECLSTIDFPRAFSKSLSIFYEQEWTSKYLEIAGGCGHVLGAASNLGMKSLNGRENLVIGNSFFEKYKGDWGQVQHDDSLLDAVSLNGEASAGAKSYKPFDIATEDAIKNAVLEVKEHREGLKSAHEKIKNLELELFAHRSSVSWKVTAPIRKVASLWIKN